MDQKRIDGVAEEKGQDALRRLIAGDRSAFTLIYEAAKRPVYYNVLAILHDADLAEDALQETFVRFLDNLAKLDTDRNPLGYLMRISYNIAIDMLRERRRSVSYPEAAEEFIGQADRSPSSGLIEKIRGLLKENEFRVVVLHVLGELTHQEIARTLKRPLGTITWTYKTALRKLKEGLADEE